MSSFIGPELPPHSSLNLNENTIKNEEKSTEDEEMIQYKSIYANQSDILKCQYNKWFPLIQDVCLKSTIIPLDQRFVEYLKADLTQLHPSLETHLNNTYIDNLDSDGEEIEFDYKVIDTLQDLREKQLKEDQSEESNEESNTEEEKDEEIPEFPELQEKLQDILAKYNHECFVKLNWSAPTDAVFMLLNHSPKCTSVHDIFLLLKSSNRVIFDLEDMFKDCHLSEMISEETEDIEEKNKEIASSLPLFQPILVVKKWANLNPAQEFRVFVHNEEVVGICQRECTTYFDFLTSQRQMIEEETLKFYEDKIAPRLNNHIKNYALDIYIDKKTRVWLLDVNPWGLPTESLMFEWEELMSDELLNASSPLIRIVENETEKLKSAKGQARGPIDVHMAPDFHRFMDIIKEQRSEIEKLESK